MVTGKAKRATGARDSTLFVVARAADARIEFAGVDLASGTWVRLADASGAHGFAPDVLGLADGTQARLLDTVRFGNLVPSPRPPFVENAFMDVSVPLTRTGHIEERALSRTLAEIAVPHLETLLPTGKRVLTTKDFLPGGRQRSIAMLRPDQLQQLHFSYEGEDVRVGISFRHRGQAYGGPTGLPCTDIKLRAFARDALRKNGTLTLTLDGRACYNRFACGRIYITVGLVEGAEGTYWPNVLGFHPIREYDAPIDYDRL